MFEDNKSKEIENHFDLKEIIRKATSYFVGSFTIEIMIRQSEWENKATKTEFIKDFHERYFSWDENATIEKTRNKVNCVIRIIESGRVEDALQYVIDSNDKKMDIMQAKENAMKTLDLIRSGEIEKRRKRYDEERI